jgi:hypothetical protein
MLRENFANSEDTDPRLSHPGVFYIDVNSIPAPALLALPLLRRLLLLPLSRTFRFCLSDHLSFMIPKSIVETF